MILPKDEQLFNFSTSHNISCSQIKPVKTFPYAYRGHFTFKIGLRNHFWPRERLQFAKICENAYSSRWCGHDVRHDLRSPILLWKYKIACQMKALTFPYKMSIRITRFKYLIWEELQRAGPSMQQKCAVDRTKMWHLTRHPELILNLPTKVNSLNESTYQELQYSCAHFNLSFADHQERRTGRPKALSTWVDS